MFGGGQATYGFMEDRAATFDTFKFLIESAGRYNDKKFRLSYFNKSPQDVDFQEIGIFETYTLLN